MTDETSIEELADDGFNMEPALPPLAVLARTLQLPTTSHRKALAAVRLQLDRLSPAPEAEILYDVVRVDTGEVEATPLWAVGVARRAEVIRACATAGRSSLSVSKVIASREVTFRFRDPSGTAGAGRWYSWAGPAAALAFSLMVLLGALDVRAREAMRAEQLGNGAARLSTDLAWRRAADRDVAVRSWLTAARGDAGGMLICSATLVARHAPGRHALVAADGSPGVATLSIAGVLAESLANVPGVTVSADGANGERCIVRVASEACGNAR